MAQDSDPVDRLHDDSEDLYDVTAWENRTVLDALSVRVAGAISYSFRAAVFAAVTLLVVVQVVATGAVVSENPLLAVLTVLSAVPAFVLAGYIWYTDPTLREPLGTLLVTFLLGIAFSTFAGLVNSLFLPVFSNVPVVGMALFFFLVVGPVEEFVKWLAVRSYAFRKPGFKAVVDGAVYGAVAGLGFAFIENLLYISQVYFEAPQFGIEQLPAAVGITGVRSLVGPGHVIFSAFAGYYLGLAKFNPENRGPIVVKGLLIAAGIHALYNTGSTYLFEFVEFSVLNFVAFILLFHGFWFAVLLRKISRYRLAYKEAVLADGADLEGPSEE